MAQWLEQCHIAWDTPSRHSGESMPVGGHDIGLNVWVEGEELLFYMDRSGSFDENNQMLKLGRVRLRLHPSPFGEGCGFRQELKLREGYAEITGTAADGGQTRIEVWVDVHQPVVHVEVYGDQPTLLEAVYENWRLQEREVPKDRRMSALSTVGYPGTVTTKPDQVAFDGEGVLFFHRNRSEELFFDKVVRLEGLGEVERQLWNPQKNLTFGGMMTGSGCKPSGVEEGSYIRTPYRGWRLESKRAENNHRVAVYLHTSQADSEEEWRRGLDRLIRHAEKDIVRAKADSREWWRAYWERSYIHIRPERPDADDPVWQAGRNYQLFRYMLGCNAFGTYPTKFNGGLFTVDPCFVLSGDDSWQSESADFRRWGGGSFTAQNQRLVYWPMLKSGDGDLMKPQFDFYLRALPNAELRTKVYWGHEGCSFTEQLENFGLPIGWGWGWPDSHDRIHCRKPFMDPTEQVAPWIKYLYLNQLEFSFMIMKFREYSGADIREYMPLIESSIRFFDEHYQYMYSLETTRRLDEQGKLVLFPSTACETYKLALNPADLVAALTAAVSAVLELPGEWLDGSERGGSRTYYRELLQRLPELPYRYIDGRKTIAPAQSWNGILNVEIPQLYPVFPYELYGIGREKLQVAIDTWRYGVDTPEQKNHVSWHQDNIFCARMGLTEEAAAITVNKLEDGPLRFPAFWGRAMTGCPTITGAAAA
ncbi:hypothetical protein SK3146_00067 [Paenibacillus konkukensis]|uniref:DUF5703 domain-containing protein n=1 Tax=Paenibacillus konkukensis TaxID=2020716 RepID=A0ABY4RDM2_9BACL|nr:DUF5703 domain-containing protein [Paenibacillus konkukensis]UQZ80911.1 hypothetical protein SK3146_00067 [Paenibacillus konkukensis]